MKSLHEDYISGCKPLLSYWLNVKKKKCVGPYLQKSFLWVEKGFSFHTISGTRLLTQSLDSEARRRQEAGLEKLYPLCSSCILLQNQGSRDTATASTQRPTSVPSVLDKWCRRTWVHPQPPMRGAGVAATPRDKPTAGCRKGDSEHRASALDESWWLGQRMTSLLPAISPPPALQSFC